MATITVDSTNYNYSDGFITNFKEFDWSDLGSTGISGGWGDWTSWDGTGFPTDLAPSSQLVFTTDVEDLGSVRTVYPLVNVITNTDTAHTIQFITSNTGAFSGEESTVSAGVLTARYIKVKVTVTNTTERPGIEELQFQYLADIISETILDVAVIHDTQDEFELPIKNSYSKILGVTELEHTGTRQVLLTDSTATAPKVRVVDLDTWGKISSDTTVSVSLVGYPNITTATNGDVVLA